MIVRRIRGERNDCEGRVGHVATATRCYNTTEIRLLQFDDHNGLCRKCAEALMDNLSLLLLEGKKSQKHRAHLDHGVVGLGRGCCAIKGDGLCGKPSLLSLFFMWYQDLCQDCTENLFYALMELLDGWQDEERTYTETERVMDVRIDFCTTPGRARRPTWLERRKR